MFFYFNCLLFLKSVIIHFIYFNKVNVSYKSRNWHLKKKIPNITRYVMYSYKLAALLPAEINGAINIEHYKRLSNLMDIPVLNAYSKIKNAAWRLQYSTLFKLYTYFLMVALALYIVRYKIIETFLQPFMLPSVWLNIGSNVNHPFFHFKDMNI